MARWPQALAFWRSRSRGTLHRVPEVASAELGNTRDLLVWLPASYRRGERRYPVIYLQDGQNLFDPATSFAGEWGLLEGLARAARRGAEAIVVGVPNMGEGRIDEYSPFADPETGGGSGDQYLDFLIHTAKPLIDQEFRTDPRPERTGIGGSSMGGLISLYGFFARPGCFGFVAALSPSLWFAGGAIFPHITTSPMVPGRVYLDTGTAEGTEALDNARRMRDLLRDKGYREGDALCWVEEAGAGHQESAWGRRFSAALPFLLSS